MSKQLVIAAALCSVLFFSASAMGAMVAYIDTSPGQAPNQRAPKPAATDFYANIIGGVAGGTTEDFESFSTPSSLPTGVSIGNTVTDFSGTGTIMEMTGTGTGGGSYPSSPDNFINLISSGLTLVFSNTGGSIRPSAFGAYLTDVSDNAGQVTLTATDGATQSFLLPDNLDDADMIFIGVTSTSPISTVSFSNNEPNLDWFGLDDVFLAEASDFVDFPGAFGVPEPHAMIVWSLLGACVFLGRRRRKV